MGGAEGICSTHWGPGSLLSSQADPLPSKAHSRLRGSPGHRSKAREIRRGRREGPSRTGRAGEEGVCPTHSSPGSLLGSQVGSPAL